MSVALLSIGTEITRGEITNTNAVWLSRELGACGFEVAVCESIPDDPAVIVQTLKRLSDVHSIVISTGGLGPTTDDLTAECAARAASVRLVRDEASLLSIRRRVESRGRVVTKSHEKQADLPEGAEVLPNLNGTAPGFGITLGKARLYFMPGVPREMKRMFSEHLLPKIQPLAPNNTYQVQLHTYGLGESAIGERLEGLEAANPGITIGYRAHFPEVIVKVHAQAASSFEAKDEATRVADIVRERLGDFVYGEGDESFIDIVARAVRAKGYRLALAESCTGGLISHLLTSIPASDYFMGAAVTYANSAKTRLLGVAEDTLRWHGAVSAEVAGEMAKGIRRVCDTEMSLAVTGIAGPTGGTAEKPVGLCYWAISHPGGTVVRHRVFAGDRDEIQKGVAYAALDHLRRIALNLPELS